MIFFLFIFGVYGGMHVYAFLKARQALGFGWAAGAPLALFMLLMVGAIFLIRLLERNDLELSARTLSWVAYLWMAFIFLAFCLFLVFDAANLALRVPGWLGIPSGTFRPIAPRITFTIAVTLSVVVCIYGYFDAQKIRTERLVFETDRLPPGTDRVTIVQISDVHLGLIVRCDRLVAMLEAVKAAKPDIFVVTGDLVDAQINHLPGLGELLHEVQAPYGKFAITGNHEYYAGLDKAIEFIEHSGLTMLRGGSKDLGVIQIAGVDDRAAIQTKTGTPASDRAALAKTDRSKKFVLFLKHQPHPDADAIGMYDLMLSGHTHKGQIWPFTFFSRRAHPLQAGRYDVGKDSVVYTSRGTGTWGPPIRFLASPEVTVIEIVRKNR
ncbi:MAG: metallophosphoesterase [Nitrospirota bacterium]